MLKVLQSEKREPYSKEKFWADLKAGTIGFATAMPIVTALGILSGIGPVAGLHCFIVVGLVAALLGGARMLVSGPSVAMAVIVATILADNGGDLAELALIAVMAGGMQVLLGLFGIGRFVSYLPHIVMAGFLSGIGARILWAQAARIFPAGIDDVAIVSLSLAVMLLWPRKIERYVPGPLAASGPASFFPSSFRAPCCSAKCRPGCRCPSYPFRRSVFWPAPSARPACWP